MIFLGSHRRPVGASGPPALANLVTETASHFTDAPTINIPATSPGQEIRVLIVQVSGTAVLTAPTDWTVLRSTVVNNNTLWLARWNGTGTRPSNTTVAFSSTVTANTVGYALVFNAQVAEGAHGVLAGAASSAQFTGPTIAPAADSTVMHVWAESGSPTLTINNPTTGFGAAAPAAYPAEQGLLISSQAGGSDFGSAYLGFVLHWGQYSGAYVAPQVTPSGFTRVGCISFEVLAA